MSVRETRRADVTRALIRAARTFTAERGLNGFTVEELCGEVAVSRRTFFNYFASKEDAVLGLPLERGDSTAAAAFLTAERQGRPLSTSLLSDLAKLAEARWRALALDPSTAEALFAAVQREPRLLGRMFELSAEAEEFDIRLIAQREGLDEGDPRAITAAVLIGAVSRSAAGEFLTGSSDSFVDIFERRIHAAREIFTLPFTSKGTP